MTSETEMTEVITPAEAHLQLARKFRMVGEFALAALILERLVASDPKFISGHLTLGLTRLESGQFLQAAAPLRRALELAVAQDKTELVSAALYGLGSAYLQIGATREIVQILDEYHKRKYGDAASRIVYATLLLSDGRWLRALSEFETALQTDPRNGEAHLGRGNSLLELGRPQEAVHAFDAALIEAPQSTTALARKSEALRQLDRVEDAVACIDRALELAPLQPLLLLAKTRILGPGALAQTVLDSITDILDREPRNLDALVSRGLAWMALKRPDQAFQDLSRAKELDPSNALIQGHLAATRVELNDIPNASMEFDRLVALQPHQPLPYTWRGEMKLKRQDYSHALKDFDRALELNEEFSWAIAYGGEALRRMHRFGEAIERLTKNLADCRPGDSWTLARRGAAYRELQKYELAEKDITESLQRNPNAVWSLVERGNVFLEQGQWKRGQADLCRALELDPEHDWALYSMGWCFLGTNEPAVSRPYFEKAFGIASSKSTRDPTYFRNRFNAALYSLMLDQPDAAIESYEAALAEGASQFAVMEAEADLRLCEALAVQTPELVANIHRCLNAVRELIRRPIQSPKLSRASAAEETVNGTDCTV